MDYPLSKNNFEQDALINNLYVVLVEPSKPQNLGSIARVMMNFGFQKLILMNPKLDLSNPEIKIVARRANHIINQSQLVTDINEIREQFNFLIGTTARVGSDYNLTRIALVPEQLPKEVVDYEKLALIFGREQDGLRNDEIALCDLLITIPTHSSYPVMNLSHAATIILYSMFLKFHQSFNKDQNNRPKYRTASYEEKQRVIAYYEKLISTSKYHPEIYHVALKAFSNLLSRNFVTGRELTTLMGVFKWIELNLQKKV